MLQLFGADHRPLMNRLTEFRPVLRRLTELGTRVVWLNQFPTLAFFGPVNLTAIDVTSEKIDNYNQRIRDILRYIPNLNNKVNI